MPGDKIDIEVWTKYFDPAQTNTPNLTALMTGVKDNGSGLTAGTVIDGAGYPFAAGTLLPFVNALTKPAAGNEVPKAYLNWAVFNRDGKQDLDRSGDLPASSREVKFTGGDYRYAGPMSGAIAVEPGETYKFRMKGYTTANLVYAYVCVLTVQMWYGLRHCFL